MADHVGSSMTDRRLLAACGLCLLALLSGCSAAGSLDMEPANDTELAAAASVPAAPEHERGEPLPEERRLAVAAIENGSATANATGPPLYGELPFAHEGAYYNVSGNVTERRSGTRVTIEVDYNASDTGGPAVDYADLPAVDREALSGLLDATDGRVPGPEIGAGVVYTDAELDESVLAPDPEYDVVVFEGERYAVSVDGTRDVTIKTYRYTAAQVAASADVYADRLERRYAFELGNLSDAEASVVAEAINDSYYADSDDDETFRSVLERFVDHEAIERDESSGTWVVHHDGKRYVAELRYGGFDVDEER